MNKISELNQTRIPIDDNFSIGADQYSWYIARKRKRKGEWVWEPFKWFPTLEMAGQALFELKVRLSGAQDCSELLQAVTRSRNHIKQALKSFFEWRGGNV